MGRPKTFDKEQILEAALRVFWKKGYTATSMRDLESATKLSSGSLYHAFGSKLRFFENALDFYLEGIVKARIQYHLGLAQDPENGLRNFIVSSFSKVPKSVEGDACFLVKTSSELGRSLPSISKVIERGFTLIVDGFQRQLQRGQDQGIWRADLDTLNAARQLLFLMIGLLVSSRQQGNPQILTDAVDFTLNSYR
ncbi:MAG: TetR/AcrR family transcriptional regulator [Planctomycetota bacterium]|nr:TetR/AcrR family transcriptional regulator [Planctomycetota bacterium]